MASPQPAQAAAQPASYDPSVRAAAEKKMGMLHSMSPATHGWYGDIRKRFTDFQVNERRKDGEVLHLTDYEIGERPVGVNLRIPNHNDKYGPAEAAAAAAAAPARVVTDEDKTILHSLLGDDTTTSILALYDLTVASGNTRLDSKSNSVKFPHMEREIRSQVHGEIRRIFDSRLETQTDNKGIIVAVPASAPQAKKSRGGRNKRSKGPSFDDLGGDYLHFTLYKENKDTMEAVNHLGRVIQVRGNHFGFAGTKDRRAATVQRMSVFRTRHQILDFLNGQMPNFKMGDYKYSKFPIQLGDHGGNQFNITVKDVNVTRGEKWSLERRVQLIKEGVELAITRMAKNGFINYYGLQRFGTHAIGTHELGTLMLKEDYAGVVDALLHIDPDLKAQVVSGDIEETPYNRDDLNRARAIIRFKDAKDPSGALKIMPRRNHVETALIEHLQKNSRDFAGAIMKITRGTRNLYLHAYQSYVWNYAASYRWSKYGSMVVAGDLVLVTTENTSPEDIEDDSQFQRARALTVEEAKGGKYTIFDIVLPGPGFDVEYPKNEVGDFYVEFMKKPENGGLDPFHMRRPIKDFNISGNYRPLLGRFKGEPKWQVRTYIDDNEQMTPTDLDLIEMRKADEKKAAPVQGTATPTGTVRPREDDNFDVELRDGGTPGETSEQPSLKRVKLDQETSGDHDDPAQPPSISTAPEATTSNDPSAQLAKPIREPTVPNGSAGFANSKQEVSADVSAVKPEDVTVARFGTGSIHSFTQPDLSQYSEDKIKIGVVLEFGLATSAYATVVLRELMAEHEPEKSSSPVQTA